MHAHFLNDVQQTYGCLRSVRALKLDPSWQCITGLHVHVVSATHVTFDESEVSKSIT